MMANSGSLQAGDQLPIQIVVHEAKRIVLSHYHAPSICSTMAPRVPALAVMWLATGGMATGGLTQCLGRVFGRPFGRTKGTEGTLALCRASATRLGGAFPMLLRFFQPHLLSPVIRCQPTRMLGEASVPGANIAEI